jgi:uncharacterized protein
MDIYFQYFIICLVSLLGSALTLFSGFGLGTLLTPIFALFFPIDLAIAMTAIVHFFNNIFKLFLVGQNANWDIVKRFGIPSVLAAFLGAFLLKQLSGIPPLYSWGETPHYLNLLKITIALALIVFALWEISPSLSKISFDKKYLPLGGFLSGFFGGLSGNQGALRSAFLLRAGLPKEAFIATGVIIACLIDMSRLSVYFNHFKNHAAQFNFTLIGLATLSAFVGAYFGNKWMKKTTIVVIQKIVATLLIFFALFLMVGLI